MAAIPTATLPRSAIKAYGARGSIVWRHVAAPDQAVTATSIDTTSPRDGRNERAVSKREGEVGTHSLGSTPASADGVGRNNREMRTHTPAMTDANAVARRVGGTGTGAERRRRGAGASPSPSHGARADAMPPTAIVGPLVTLGAEAADARRRNTAGSVAKLVPSR